MISDNDQNRNITIRVRVLLLPIVHCYPSLLKTFSICPFPLWFQVHHLPTIWATTNRFVMAFRDFSKLTLNIHRLSRILSPGRLASGPLQATSLIRVEALALSIHIWVGAHIASPVCHTFRLKLVLVVVDFKLNPYILSLVAFSWTISESIGIAFAILR
jgi:hypothetical protein